MPKVDKGSTCYSQKYTKKWETEAELKGFSTKSTGKQSQKHSITLKNLDWIGPDPTGQADLAFCKYFRTSLSAQHENAVLRDKSAQQTKKLDSTFKPVVTDNVKIAELRIAAFIAEHYSLKTVDHMVSLLPQLDPSSNILGKLKLHRTKCTMVIKNILGPCMLDQLIDEIGDSPFSIIVNESTDSSTMKTLCIMLRFFSEKKKELVTTFYRLIKIIDCDAKSIYQAIKSQLENDKLNVNNMVGIGVDGASVMVGKHKPVTALFQRELSDLIIMRCVCHSLHLCAEKAADVLPSRLDHFVKGTHNYFSNSPKRWEEYKKLFEDMNNNNHKCKKIQGLSGTRWLARFDALSTILEQWKELEMYFSSHKHDCYTASLLHDTMSRTPYKAFLVFLKSELKTVVQMNILFQSDNVEPTKLFEDLFLMYKNLLYKIVTPSRLQKVSDNELVAFEFKPYGMHTAAINFGYDFECIAKNITRPDIEDVRERCKTFLIVLAENIQLRLPDNLSVLKTMADLHPKVATSQLKPSLNNILTQIHRTDLYGNKNDIESEWNKVHNKSWSNLSNSVDFYAEVSDDCDAAGHKRFKNIAKFAMALFTVPISNASVERAFSIYNIFKSKLRNKFTLELLQSLMMVKFSIQRNYGSCVNFIPSSSMLKLFNVKMYNFKTTDTNKEQAAHEFFEIINELGINIV